MAQANEQKNISFEDVWGKNVSANIISGKVATPLCLGFLGVCHNEKDSAHSLNRIMQALARCQLNEELLLLLEIICDIADILIVHCASGYNSVVITGKEEFISVARPDIFTEE